AQVRHADPRRPAGVVEPGLEPALVATCGTNMAQPRRSPGNPGQLDGVKDQWAESDIGPGAADQSARGGKDRGGIGWHGREAYRPPPSPCRGRGRPVPLVLVVADGQRRPGCWPPATTFVRQPGR